MTNVHEWFTRLKNELLAVCPYRESPSFLGHATHTLLYDLVGEGEQHRGRHESQHLSGFEIDDELIFGRLLHRQIGRLFATDQPRDAVALV